MCTYLVITLGEANTGLNMERGGTRLGRLEGAKEVPVAASLPDIWEELITELQFSQSLAAKSEAGRAASE